MGTSTHLSLTQKPKAQSSIAHTLLNDIDLNYLKKPPHNGEHFYFGVIWAIVASHMHQTDTQDLHCEVHLFHM